HHFEGSLPGLAVDAEIDEEPDRAEKLRETLLLGLKGRGEGARALGTEGNRSARRRSESCAGSAFSADQRRYDLTGPGAVAVLARDGEGDLFVADEIIAVLMEPDAGVGEFVIPAIEADRLVRDKVGIELVGLLVHGTALGRVAGREEVVVERLLGAPHALLPQRLSVGRSLRCGGPGWRGERPIGRGFRKG